MELEVQRYLRSGKSLADLQAEYGIKASAGSTTDRVALNYDGLFSPMEEQICQECRSLILEIGTWNVVGRSFFKFFNHGEVYAHEIDWSTARVQEKLDGTLITLYHFGGEWHVATRSTPDASGACSQRGEIRASTFRRLVEITLKDMGFTFEEFTSQLDPAIFYAFELTTPENVVIVPQTERRLTWLAAWRAETLEECVPSRIPPGPSARTYPLTSLTEILQACEVMDAFCREGFVVCDAQGRRIKIKSPSYLLADKVLGLMGTPKRKIEVLLSDRLDDLMPILPVWAQEEMTASQSQLRDFITEVQATFDRLKPLVDNRREFAQAAKAYPYSVCLFKLLDGRDLMDTLRKISPDLVATWVLREAARVAD